MTVELPSDATRRIAGDEVAWLTTVTGSGLPAPNPVWFVRDGDDLLVFSTPDAKKVGNIGKRPRVTLHFNSDPHGGDIVVIAGTATLTHDKQPSAAPGYLDKYEASITGPLNMTVDQMDATYSTEIRIRPTGVRGTPPT